MPLMYLALGVAPYAIMIVIKILNNYKSPNKNFVTSIVFAITGLMFILNQVSNSSSATIPHDLKGIGNLLTSYAVNILWMTCPMIFWWLLDIFAKFKFDLFFLGLESIHFPAWIASVLLMHTDPRDALGWIIVPFLQAYMLVISLAIYFLSKKIFKRQQNTRIERIIR